MSSKADEDLILILQHPAIKLEAKLQGWEYVLGLTATEEGVQKLVSSKYVHFMTEYIQESIGDPRTLQMAYKSLINISSSLNGTSSILSASENIILFLLENVNLKCHVEQTCYLLSNITYHHNMCEDPRSIEKLSETLAKLPGGFLSSRAEEREKYKFLALVFANVSKQSDGRRVLLQDPSFLSSIVSCTNLEEPDVRRLGIALTIRNCCFETGIHSKLLGEIDALPFLLLPLMGPEEYEEDIMEKFPLDCQYLEATKKRERLPQVRKALVHALVLLCYTEEGWNCLKCKGVYYIMRDLHLWEQDPDTREAIETLVGYLLVEQYTPPSSDSESSFVIPTETDILNDIPDFVV